LRDGIKIPEAKKAIVGKQLVAGIRTKKKKVEG